jgi:hypothetical protein
MNMSGMSFDALPPIDIPFRFFATAIAFMMGLAFFVYFSGDILWISRWHPAMLALTHGFTLGFITPIMMGALLQMLPVVGGIGLKNVGNIGRICYPLHFIGTALLMYGFVSTGFMQSNIKVMAIILLALSFSYYIFSVCRVLLQYFSQKLTKNIFSQNPTIVTIIYSILALLITVILGFLLQVQNINSPYLTSFNFDKSFTNIHALWGGVGWMSLLILAISLQVIPMFHVAPSFPKFSARLIPIVILLSLIIMLAFPRSFSLLLNVLLLSFMLHNLVLLKVINQRKRKIPDTSINTWRLAAFSLALILLFHYFPEQWLPNIVASKKSLLLSAAFIHFYLLSIILGMLIKILPFLSYTHLQQRCLSNFNAMKFLPNMHDLLNKKSANFIFYCHLFSGCSLIITVVIPKLYWLFSAFLFIEFSLFFMVMLRTIWVYRQSSIKIRQVESSISGVINTREG